MRINQKRLDKFVEELEKLPEFKVKMYSLDNPKNACGCHASLILKTFKALGLVEEFDNLTKNYNFMSVVDVFSKYLFKNKHADRDTLLTYFHKNPDYFGNEHGLYAFSSNEPFCGNTRHLKSSHIPSKILVDFWKNLSKRKPPIMFSFADCMRVFGYGNDV